jgi:hypothetical protein
MSLGALGLDCSNFENAYCATPAGSPCLEGYYSKFYDTGCNDDQKCCSTDTNWKGNRKIVATVVSSAWYSSGMFCLALSLRSDCVTTFFHCVTLLIMWPFLTDIQHHRAIVFRCTPTNTLLWMLLSSIAYTRTASTYRMMVSPICIIRCDLVYPTHCDLFALQFPPCSWCFRCTNFGTHCTWWHSQGCISTRLWSNTREWPWSWAGLSELRSGVLHWQRYKNENCSTVCEWYSGLGRKR